MSQKIAVIVGTTRPTRIGRDIAEWFISKVSQTPDTTFDVIDLKEVNLPFFDERLSPQNGVYEKDYTKKWKETIDAYDGYVFVTAEYNAGYPAPLKNAIDYLSAEWNDKPAVIVSYGWGGGASASAQLRQVLERLKMNVAETMPALFFGPDTFDENAQLKDIDTSFAENIDGFKQAVAELVELI